MLKLSPPFLGRTRAPKLWSNMGTPSAMLIKHQSGYYCVWFALDVDES